MALSDLLRAIEADAAADRARAARHAAAAAAEIIEQARQEAAALEAELTRAPEADALVDREREHALARLEAVDVVRAARETAFLSVRSGVQAELATLRRSDSYPALFRALLSESRAALPSARELHVDRRDFDLAASVAGDLRVVTELHCWGGLELASEDGRSIRNTLEERLANADVLLRMEFEHRLGMATEPGSADGRQ
jgi:vacuolar-type H+-ATPase subunit E/Vma4